MTPVMGRVSDGLPACLHGPLVAAQQRYPDVSLMVARDGDEYVIAAAANWRLAEQRVPECIVNHDELPNVMAHYFEVLVAQLQTA